MSRSQPQRRPDRLPATGETCAVSQKGNEKRDALLFDRIYCSTASFPEAINAPPNELTFGTLELDRQAHERAKREGLADVDLIWDAMHEFGSDYVFNYRTRFIADFFNDAGIDTVPSYRSDEVFFQEFPDGNDSVYAAVINNVPVLDQRNTSWDEILEFRRDEEAIRKYRNLRVWLRDGLKSESVENATDIIGQKLDGYEWALRKHGLKTVIGALSQVFSWKHSAITTAAAATAGTFGGPIAAAIVGGLVFTAQTSVGVAERRITLEDVKRGPNSEVAILHDIKQQFQSEETA